MIRKLVPFIKRYKKQALLAPLLIVFEVLLEIFIPYLMSHLIDVGLKNGDLNYVMRTGALMVIMALLAMVCGALAGKFAAVAAVGYAADLRETLFNKVQRLSISDLEAFGTPTLITRLTTDITNIQMVLMMILRVLVRAPIMLIAATSIAIYINRSLSFVFLVAVPILAIAMYFISTASFPRFQVMLKQYDKINEFVKENIEAIRTVKAYVKEEDESKRFSNEAETLRNLQMRAEKLVVMSMPLMVLVIYACMITISWFGGQMIITGSMQTGEFMSFLSYVGQILVSMMMVAMVFVMMVISKASAGRIVEILDSEQLEEREKSNINWNERKGATVEFKDVSFNYLESKDLAVLSDINLKIDEGKTVAVIGGTGSGKTTLVHLILGLYDVSEGNLYVNGKNIKEISREEIADAVSIVFQRDLLFSGTIAENLRLSKKDASMEEIRKACKIAMADEFVASFKEGYETVLGQAGVNISGGQKQRLCIARALLKQPKIIIFDDSTSAVDLNTEKNIRENLKKHLEGVTTIWITQRISSAKTADEIIVIDDGKIIAKGKHEELANTCNVYKELIQSQRMGGDLS